jgi:hypothetical protein
MKKQKKVQKKDPHILGILAVVAVAAVIVIAAVSYYAQPGEPDNPTGTQPSYPLRVEDAENVSINLGYGMYLEDVAKYTGVYMEDGSDEVVSGILMVMVKNTGTQDIQYAEIEMPVGDKLACFTLTNLPMGESVVLLEKNRMEFNSDVKYMTSIAKNVIVFQEPMTLLADKLRIQGKSGVLNITNISDEDITGNIMIYYKNSSSNMLYGGITYRVMITGGIKAGETRQAASGHYSSAGSRIVQITCS